MNTEDIVLVIYINIGQKSIEDATTYMERVQKDIETKTQKFTCFFIPIRHGDSKIECINPILLDKKDYAVKVSKILVDYEIKLIDFLSNPEPVKKVRKKTTIEVPKKGTGFVDYIMDKNKQRPETEEIKSATKPSKKKEIQESESLPVPKKKTRTK